MYRLGERLRLDLDPPEATVEVDTVVSAVIAAQAVGLVEAFRVADGAGDIDALDALYAFVVNEAQPTWDFIDHRGPIPPTVDGFRRLPLPLALTIVDLWTDTLHRATPVDPDAAAGPDGGGLTPGPSDAELAAARQRARRG